MILVTGGLGFIGTHTGRALLDLGEEVVLAQRGPRELPADLAGAAAETMDCTDLESVLAVGRRHRITGIVHLAAVGIGRAASTVDELSAGTQALFTILRAAREWGADRVVLASTIGVYAGTQTDLYREDAPLPMTSFHAIPAAKKTAEIIANTVAASGEVDAVNARIGAIWGPGGRPVSPFFAAPQLVNTAVHGGEPVTAYADSGIDLLYAPDCGRALAQLTKAPVLSHRTYNVGSGRVTTNREVADAIGKARPGAEPVLLPGRDPRSAAPAARLDIERLVSDTAYRPAFTLDTAVADYIAWLR